MGSRKKELIFGIEHRLELHSLLYMQTLRWQQRQQKPILVETYNYLNFFAFKI